MFNASVKIAAMLLLFVLGSHAVPTNATSAMAEASAAGQFLCLTFYETKDASFTTMSSTVAAFKKASTKRIAIYNANLSDPANKETAAKYGIKNTDLPVLLVMAPNGVVTNGASKTVTADQLEQSVSVSDLMLKTLKPLLEQKVALVALQNSSTKFNDESLQGVNDFANDPQYKQYVAVVKADPAAKGSQDFVKQCQLLAPLAEATVVVLLPPGQIGKILTGKVTKADILKSLQSCKTGSGCCSDRRFKENIKPIVSALDKVTKLQGVTFTWNRKDYPRRFFTEEPQIGLIAQDVEKIIPEVVHADKDSFKTLEYDKLTAVLIEAVKEMKMQVNSQDSIIKVQSAQIKALQAKR